MVPAAVRRMKLAGYATVEGTRRYRDRLVAAGAAHAGHFREGLGGLALSTIGLGTYLGKHDDATDVVADCHCMTPTYLRHQIDSSLANFGLACLDVYYLHNPEIQLEQVSRDEFMARMRTAFETLEAAVAQGKLRVYGTATWDGYRVSPKARGHLSLEALVRLAEEVGGTDHHFRVIQLPYNLGMPEALTWQTQSFNGVTVSLLEAAKALNMYVMVSAPILQGRLARGLPADLHQALGAGTDAQRGLQFVRSTPGIGTALVGMKQADHVRENLALARLAPLSPDQIAKVFA